MTQVEAQIYGTPKRSPNVLNPLEQVLEYNYEFVGNLDQLGTKNPK